MHDIIKLNDLVICFKEFIIGNKVLYKKGDIGKVISSVNQISLAISQEKDNIKPSWFIYDGANLQNNFKKFYPTKLAKVLYANE